MRLMVLYYQPAVYVPDYYGVLKFTIPLNQLSDIIKANLLD
ncbi:MAG: hypothetical protein M0Z55_05310 [Peptococcaceae bacterium]|nr:hypothetical protein [Peptococcaceae bacterium]